MDIKKIIPLLLLTVVSTYSFAQINNDSWQQKVEVLKKQFQNQDNLLIVRLYPKVEQITAKQIQEQSESINKILQKQVKEIAELVWSIKNRAEQRDALNQLFQSFVESIRPAVLQNQEFVWNEPHNQSIFNPLKMNNNTFFVNKENTEKTVKDFSDLANQKAQDLLKFQKSSINQLKNSGVGSSDFDKFISQASSDSISLHAQLLENIANKVLHSGQPPSQLSDATNSMLDTSLNAIEPLKTFHEGLPSYYLARKQYSDIDNAGLDPKPENKTFAELPSY